VQKPCLFTRLSTFARDKVAHSCDKIAGVTSVLGTASFNRLSFLDPALYYSIPELHVHAVSNHVHMHVQDAVRLSDCPADRQQQRRAAGLLQLGRGRRIDRYMPSERQS